MQLHLPLILFESHMSLVSEEKNRVELQGPMLQDLNPVKNCQKETSLIHLVVSDSFRLTLMLVLTASKMGSHQGAKSNFEVVK